MALRFFPCEIAKRLGMGYDEGSKIQPKGSVTKQMTKIMKKTLCVWMAMAILFTLAACGKAPTCQEFALGDGLPAWQFSEPRRAAKLPKDAEAQGLEAIYTADQENASDIYVYRCEKPAGVTLEEMGQELAARYKVFCSMTTLYDCPTANVTYYDTEGDAHYIVRSYLFEGENAFVKVCIKHETQQIPLGISDLSLRMMSNYTEIGEEDSPFPCEQVYLFDDTDLPTVRVRQFAKDYFTAETYDAHKLPGTDRQQYAAYAADGWTLEEIIQLYQENYDLIKGELIHRNGFDAAFIGYIDDGNLCARAYIDYGEDYIGLCADDEASTFQHVVNPLIDTITD